MDEGQEHRHRDQHQQVGHGDGQLGDPVAAVDALLDPAVHRAQHGQGVDERRRERAQRVLGQAVLEEGAQHAGGVLARGELQHHHRDREDQAGHRDHRAGDRGEHGARPVDPAGEEQRHAVDQPGELDVRQQQAEPHDHEAPGGRDHPERPEDRREPARGTRGAPAAEAGDGRDREGYDGGLHAPTLPHPTGWGTHPRRSTPVTGVTHDGHDVSASVPSPRPPPPPPRRRGRPRCRRDGAARRPCLGGPLRLGPPAGRGGPARRAPLGHARLRHHLAHRPDGHRGLRPRRPDLACQCERSATGAGADPTCRVMVGLAHPAPAGGRSRPDERRGQGRPPRHPAALGRLRRRRRGRGRRGPSRRVAALARRPRP